jgi:hypothetical protein
MIDWSSLAVVAVVGAAVALTVVTLVALAIVGLSGRPDPAASPSPAGRAVAGLCLVAVATIVSYGLYVIAA